MENNNKPVVHLISKPDNMLKTIYTAARTCYRADTPFKARMMKKKCSN